VLIVVGTRVLEGETLEISAGNIDICGFMFGAITLKRR
jgi:hypothetical protein